MRGVALILLLLPLSGCFDDPGGQRVDTPVATPEPGPDLGIALERLWGDFERPLLVTHADEQLFVVEQCGKVWQMPQRSLWLDITPRVSCSGEQGLLGLAFPDDHAATGHFYVAYTDNSGTSILERRIVADGAPTEASTELLRVTQPASNHNGGHIAFGPDGYLYMGLGDGGLARDAFRQGQNKGTLLGTVLRLDVAGAFEAAYGIPQDNPFVDDPAGANEIWAWGLRNPWRFSFDRATGDLWIADVGQDAWEEVNFEAAGGTGGVNYGWPVYEGTHLHEPGVAIDHVLPVAEYANQGGDCSVTGGFVHRGNVSGLVGKYVLGDYCSGTIRTVVSTGDGWALQDTLDTDLRISSFGEDASGTLYVVDHQGAVHRFV